MSIEGQGHFFTIYFPGFVYFVLPRYQVRVYRTIGPLVVTSVFSSPEPTSIGRGNEKLCFLFQSDKNSGCYGNL